MNLEIKNPEISNKLQNAAEPMFVNKKYKIFQLFYNLFEFVIKFKLKTKVEK